MLTWRTTAVIALALVLLAGCSSSTAPPPGKNGAAPTAAGPATPADPKSVHGDEAALETTPWDQVGPGWMLATWTQVPATVVTTDPSGSYQGAATTLYLVDPSGDRYPITTFPQPGKTPGPALVDWSGDGERALFYDQSADKPAPIIVDLHTGAQTAIPVRGSTQFVPHFTRPSGKALLIVHKDDSGNQPPTLERVDLAGERELLFPTDNLGSPFSGSYLPTPDGTQLILGTDTGPMVLMGNDGTVVRTIAVPHGATVNGGSVTDALLYPGQG
ncbi:TolB-like translocation protein [Mycolicibacterium helvum]|uniref:Uncharacterized protein n=1 Tax=Mycolicibacterium helvum TaxID=1534349 RepID=A0A7I7T1R2_9MYCO|nr:hypothetical protein [Mycolicibacterium helvum]BBY62880.1 hypothetical protein MHEL_11230 [Mycolicibacterium helvum]